MKTKLAILIASVFLFATILSACGGGGKSEGASSSSNSAAATGEVKEVTLTGTNFDWGPKEIRVKKGDTVKLTLVNKEGMHGVEIKDLKVKLDKAGTTEFVADKTGEFEFICSIMCGTGHDKMVGKLIVE